MGKKQKQKTTLEFVHFKSPFQSDLITPKLTMQRTHFESEN